jgi:hypothetical protein
MRANMKKCTSTLTGVVLATVVLFLQGTASADPAAMDPVSGGGVTQLIPCPPPAGIMMQFEGMVVLSIRGELRSAHLLVNVYSIEQNEEGVQHVTASHVLTFDDDGSTIVTSDKEVAEPTDTPGVVTLNASLDVVAGTGAYEGATGNLTAHGTMDFTGFLPTACFTLQGVVSSPATE